VNRWCEKEHCLGAAVMQRLHACITWVPNPILIGADIGALSTALWGYHMCSHNITVTVELTET
jgi:hypothetical protein